MIFKEIELPGAYLIELQQFQDDRGFFARSFCTAEFEKAGLHASYAQQNTSNNLKKGTLRGFHWQTPPHEEVKIMRCVRGAIFSVIVDVRPDSPTYTQWRGFELSADNRLQLYVPAGFANGYLSLEDGAEVTYFASRPYAPGAEKGLRFDDPAIGIKFPIEPVIVSDKDRSWPDFAR
jgi:dTDP-4-dehydrorhamnose 3,5-epimerase